MMWGVQILSPWLFMWISRIVCKCKVFATAFCLWHRRIPLKLTRSETVVRRCYMNFYSQETRKVLDRVLRSGGVHVRGWRLSQSFLTDVWEVLSMCVPLAFLCWNEAPHVTGFRGSWVRRLDPYECDQCPYEGDPRELPPLSTTLGHSRKTPSVNQELGPHQTLIL